MEKLFAGMHWWDWVGVITGIFGFLTGVFGVITYLLSVRTNNDTKKLRDQIVELEKESDLESFKFIVKIASDADDVLLKINDSIIRRKEDALFALAQMKLIESMVHKLLADIASFIVKHFPSYTAKGIDVLGLRTHSRIMKEIDEQLAQLRRLK